MYWEDEWDKFKIEPKLDLLAELFPFTQIPGVWRTGGISFGIVSAGGLNELHPERSL